MNLAHSMTNKQSGLSLVELLVALTIGLLLLSGLTLIFVNSSEANRELQKTAQQIENGRYAIDVISLDLRLAGFYGHYYELPAAPGALPDACEIASAANLQAALALPVQGFRAADLATRPDVSGTTCGDGNKNLLTTANLKPGSDVLVIRRTDTNVLARPGGVATTNEFYLQATGTQADVQIGNGAAIGASNKANGAVSTLFLNDTTTPAPIRKLHVHVYFVAPCSAGSGSVTVNGVAITGICTGTPPEDTIPTLKRLELISQGGNATMRLVPLVEGIEYLKIEYGVDTSPTDVDKDTGLTGDATADSYVDLVTTPLALDDWPKVIAAKIYVLARNTEATSGHVDDKTYVLGPAPGVDGVTKVLATNDRFRRHVYTAAVRLMSPSGRRERP